MLRVDTERRFLPRFKNRGLAPSNVSKYLNILNFDDLALDLLSEVQNTEGGFMNKRAGGGAGVEKIDVLDLMICRGVSVTVNDGIDFIKFFSDA
jgi:hypothetical protein